MKKPRAVHALLVLLLSVLLTACGDDEPAAPETTIEAIGERAFDALITGDLEPLRPVLADEADMEWFLAEVDKAGAPDLAREMRAARGDVDWPERLWARYEEHLGRARSEMPRGLEWGDAVYRGIDEDLTELGDPKEGITVPEQDIVVPIQHAQIWFLVEAAGRRHRFRVAAFRRPGTGWVAVGGPSHAGVTGWSGPLVARIRLALELGRARAEGRIAAREAEATVADLAARILRERLKQYGVAEPDVRLAGPTTLEVGVPASLEPEALVPLLTASGDLRLRIEVLPVAGYRDWEDEAPARLADASKAPWPKSAASFAAFKAREVAHWQAARAANAPYVPSDPRYFVAPRHATEAGAVEDFAILEEPAEPLHRFDGGLLVDPVSTTDDRGRPVVVYEVRREHQQAFGDWTEANVGLPMAILMDGEVRSALYINDRLTRNVQITLGDQQMGEARREAEALAAILRTGALKVPLRVIEIVKAPPADDE